MLSFTIPSFLLALSFAVSGVYSRPHRSFDLVCYEDNQLRALERFSNYADEFCPEFLANTGRYPRWLDHWQKQKVSSACSCYEKTATSHGAPSTATATGISFLASSTAPVAISEVFATTTPTGGYFPSTSASAAASTGYYPSGSGASSGYFPTASGVSNGFLPSSYSLRLGGTVPASSGTAPIVAPASPSSTSSTASSSTPEYRPVSKYPPQPFGEGPGKRGLVYDNKSQDGWSELFKGSKEVTYGSNWGVDRGTQLDESFSYVPTITVDSDLNNNDWNTLVPVLIEGGTKGLFASNEPDNAGQANLTPSQAATVFKKYLQPYVGTVQLGTPAVTNGGGQTGLTYLENFVKQCSNCTFDFVNVHYYLKRSDVDVAQFVQAAKDYIEKDIPAVANQYPQLKGVPIYIGEWWLTGASLDEGSDLMDAMLPYLDQNPNVLGHSAFGGLWEGNFINADGTGLTPAGQKYSTLTTAAS